MGGSEMQGRGLPVAHAPVQSTRAALVWVGNDDLPLLEERSEAGTAALSLISGGGGHLYVGDLRRGFGLLGLQAGAIALAATVSFGWLAVVVTGVGSAIASWRKARAINRYLAAVRQAHYSNSPYPPEYRLVAAMTAADPSAWRAAAEHKRLGQLGQASPPADPVGANPADPAHANIVLRLRKLAALRANQVLTDVELAGRKAESLESACGDLNADSLDDLLFALMPLVQEGILDEQDIEFVKRLGGM